MSNFQDILPWQTKGIILEVEITGSFVLTGEPETGFIPKSMKPWQDEAQHNHVINFNQQTKSFDFGEKCLGEDILSSGNSQLMSKAIVRLWLWTLNTPSQQPNWRLRA